ncbi:MAG: hypothetical protein EBQ96_07940 [Proteobacteria bacterium]|nr:hypothetical protein [Pseudomonadota bacterium]
MAFLENATNWVLISFVIFAVVFFRVGWKQVLAKLDAKIDSIRNEIDAASKLRLEAADMLAQYQARHASAMKEAAEISARAKTQAEAIRAKAEDDLRETLARREKQLAERLTRIEQAAEAELRAATAAIALSASDTIIRKGLDAKGHSALVDQSVSSLSGI